MSDDFACDLDGAEPPPAERVQHPMAAVLTVIVVVAAVIGVGARAAASHTAAGPDRAVLVARLDLREASLQPTPTAVLRFSVHNSGDRVAEVTGVTVRGGGATEVSRPVKREVRPDSAVTFDIPVPMSCSLRGQLRFPLAAQVTLDQGAFGRVAPLDVVPARDVDGPDGLCRASDAFLPAGWRYLVKTQNPAVVGEDFQVELVGLPTDRKLAGVWAGLDSINIGAVPQIGAGPLALRLSPPGVDCTEVLAGQDLPVGLRLVLVGEGRAALLEGYAVVGRELAEWLRAAQQQQCPELGRNLPG